MTLTPAFRALSKTSVDSIGNVECSRNVVLDPVYLTGDKSGWELSLTLFISSPWPCLNITLGREKKCKGQEMLPKLFPRGNCKVQPPCSRNTLQFKMRIAAMDARKAMARMREDVISKEKGLIYSSWKDFEFSFKQRAEIVSLMVSAKLIHDGSKEWLFWVNLYSPVVQPACNLTFFFSFSNPWHAPDGQRRPSFQCVCCHNNSWHLHLPSAGQSLTDQHSYCPLGHTCLTHRETEAQRH